MKPNSWWHCAKALLKFRGYRPQPVTVQSFTRWLEQFENESDRRELLRAMDAVRFIDEQSARRALVELNDALLKRLADAGVAPKRLIYVQYDDPGSSSPVMLNLLRDATQLDRRGCHLVDASNHLELYKATNAVEEGVIIYVDDFVGTGNQFLQMRTAISQQIVGTFSEFLLVGSDLRRGNARGLEVGRRACHKVHRPESRQAATPL